MAYPYEAKLRAKAGALITALQNKNISAQLQEKSFREYHVKVTVDGGRLIIYYKPTRDEFSLRYHELKDKSHLTQIEACWQGVQPGNSTIQASATPFDLRKVARSDYQAFVDGSYDRKRVGYGAVMLHQGEEVQRFSGRVKEHTESRQIGGELAATMRILDWCEQQNIAEIDIFFDYIGIQKWATGDWKASSPVAQAYVRYMKKSKIRVHWHKVKSHTGNYWNEVADKLAKQGTDLE